MSFRELVNSPNCSFKHQRNSIISSFQRNTNNSASKTSEVVLSVIQDFVKGDVEWKAVSSEIYKRLEDYADLFFNKRTLRAKQEQVSEDVNRLISYLVTQGDAVVSPPIELDLFGKKETIAPTFLLVKDKSITAVRVFASKRTIPKKAEQNNKALYTLVKYAQAFADERLTEGNKIETRGEIWYLRKQTDSRDFEGNLEKYDTHFALTDSNNPSDNILSLLATYNVGDMKNNVVTQIDKIFKEIFELYWTGMDPEDIEQSDCEYCPLNRACHYQSPPMALVKEQRQVDVHALSLTKAQEMAINFNTGICRINAAAGAGKTLIVALNTVSLLESGVLPEEILLITFTENGALEMKERVAAYAEDYGIGDDISGLNVVTFNAFGDRIVREEFQRWGFTKPPRVIDDVQRSMIIARLLKEHEIDGLNYLNFTLDMLYSKGALAVARVVFQKIKANNLGIQDAEALWEDEQTMIKKSCSLDAVKELFNLYDEYDAILKKENLIEFADQEVLLFDLLKSDPYYMDTFGYKHIIVDEFQDTSKNQMEILKFLIQAPHFESLMVVGDDSQAIYGFRDTSPEYLINFFNIIEEDGEDIYLIENHRSTPEIIDFANKINDINRNKVEKSLISTREPGKGVFVQGYFTEQSEKREIVRMIKEKIDEGHRYEEIAFLAATQSELLKMASLLAKENIPSVMLNPEPYAENSRILAAIDLVAAFEDPYATQSIYNVINAELKGNIFDLADVDVMALIENKRSEIMAVKSNTEEEKAKWLMKEFESFDEDDEIYQAFIGTLKSLPSVKKVIEYCRNFLEFGSNTKKRRDRSYPGIVLTTSHSSKGLEWPIVFVSITKFDTKGLARYSMVAPGSKKEKNVEEKRRLFFVSATRARDELFVTGVYRAFGSMKDFTFNQFLMEAYKVVGKDFMDEVSNFDDAIKEQRELDKMWEQDVQNTKNKLSSSVLANKNANNQSMLSGLFNDLELDQVEFN